jgi:hypothetical protein
MKKYNEEYFSVIDKRTGRKIVDCAEYSDAMLMLNFDPNNRVITRNHFLMGQVVDIETPKQLPTSEIVVNMTSGFGGSLEVEESMGVGRQLPQIKLPEGQGKPVKV